jgi:hypothetical protein
MKKILFVLLFFVVGILLSSNAYGSQTQKLSIIDSKYLSTIDLIEWTTEEFFDDLVLSFENVVEAYSIASEDYELLLQILIQVGSDNHQNNTNVYYIDSPYENQSSSSEGKQYNIFGRILTSSEISLLFNYPFHILSWINSANIAISKTNELYDTTADGSIANAFQHAYWNVLMVKAMGATIAEEFATAHEAYEGNPIIHKTMDLFNNQVGRNFASYIDDLSNKSDSWLADQTKASLIDIGETMYILFDYEYLRYIYLFDDRTEYVHGIGDFLAWTIKTFPISVPNYEVIDRRSNPGPIPLPFSIGEEE